MPKTAKARNKNVAAKSCDGPKHTARKPKSKEGCIKGLVADAPKGAVVEEVFHRKSERRRVARDIFLVFEEESNCRRKTRSNKKQTKPKFGHLKVEDRITPKGLLRDIKNEPKCYASSSRVGVTASMPTEGVKSRSNNLNSLKTEEKNVKSREKKVSISKAKSDCSNKSKNIKSLKIALDAEPCTFDTEQDFVARVNPIFLWVKQDNTRIVEVRCEDYDKRNRIRITKTSNGWRSIPRSDPTTSRVLKFYPTPLMKVKREGIHEAESVVGNNTEKKEIMVGNCFSIPSIFPVCVTDEIGSKLNRNDTVCNPVAIKNIKKSRRKLKKLKKKPNFEETLKTNSTADIQSTVNNETLPKLLNPPFKINASEVLDFPEQITTTLETIIDKEISVENHMLTKDFDDNIPVHNFESNSDMKNKSNSSNSPVTYTLPPETKSPYLNESENDFFHLCPKTGLFLRNHMSVAEYENESNEKIDERNTLRAGKNTFLLSTKNEYNSSTEKNNIDSKLQIAEENTESLEAKTKNLKDLLDDADLLQNCDDNTNSDADLIDTIVKTTCENNLIQANEIISKASIDQLNQKSLHRTNDMVVHLIADVSDPPKCLSFNEAGEIEGLNGELFQSNTYIEAFDKQASVILTEPQIMLHSTTSALETTVTSQKSSSPDHIESIVRNMEMNTSDLQPLNETEDSPKDLSYKKREEVCPPSESRSQCAVTSSSDVVKSPTREGTPPLASSSETLKNLILEQFLKLNVLTKQHQREPIDLEKQKHSEPSNVESLLYTSKPAQFNNFIETVVIEDDENGCDIEHEEPLKKRSRLNKHKIVTQNVGKLSMIDEDPDPLTQLRLLIRNTQWKVPDPILVPKDRLSAVLASPAREIPLLITTRPELRLPEAFAYPEIIQNPNILVISMAQLEAILKNELEVEKRETKAMKPEVNQQLSSNQIDAQYGIKDLALSSPTKQLQHGSKDPKNILSCASNIREANNKSQDHTDIATDSLSEKRHECTKNSQTTSSLSDINSATMAVLNQMLWLPYFGKLSKTLQEKCSNLDPFVNSKLNGITNLEEIIKNIPNKKIDEKSVSNTRYQTFQQQFTPNEELSLFQQIVQHQMQSVLELNQLKADSSQVTAAVAEDTTVFSIDKSIASLPNLVEQRKQKVYPNKQTNTSMCKNHTNNSNNNILVQEKSYNLRSSVAGRHSIEPKQYSNYNQRQVTDNKPRLTCKSLSNLLDPEHNILPTPSSSTPLVQNLSTDYLKNINEVKRSSSDCKVNPINTEGKRQYSCNATIVPELHTSSYSNMNVSFESISEINKLKPKAHENYHSNTDAPALTTETNVPLWHPLFGSNTKTAYSSPWQWTTVTATGE